MTEVPAPPRRQPLDARQAADLARTLKAVADPVRLRLVSMVAAHEGGEACVCELTEPLGLTQPTVSHHLKILVDAGIFTRDKRGVWAYYALVPGALEALSALLAATPRRLPNHYAPSAVAGSSVGSVLELTAIAIGVTHMRLSRPAPAALRPMAVLPAVVVAAAVCLSAAACHSPAATAGSAYGTASAAPTASMPASSPAASAQDMLTVRKTSAGYVLATRTGQTIYWYSDDVKGSGKSTCTGTCLTAWPAVTGSPMAAAGVQLAGKLGTITRSGGVVQATYNGYPLYTYAQDMSPGQVLGNGVGGVWHVITGSVLSASPASAAAASLADTSGSSGSSGSSATTAPSSPAATSTGYGGGY